MGKTGQRQSLVGWLTGEEREGEGGSEVWDDRDG